MSTFPARPGTVRGSSVLTSSPTPPLCGTICNTTVGNLRRSLSLLTAMGSFVYSIFVTSVHSLRNSSDRLLMKYVSVVPESKLYISDPLSSSSCSPSSWYLCRASNMTDTSFPSLRYILRSRTRKLAVAPSPSARAKTMGVSCSLRSTPPSVTAPAVDPDMLATGCLPKHSENCARRMACEARICPQNDWARRSSPMTPDASCLSK
mmetsp:Transcript_25877/g.62133  ORF Transcript_25877/g.62133 Transcript_25877/m.62133 type:complete len:206 (+) Transcript_25877:1281-1898(+)